MWSKGFCKSLIVIVRKFITKFVLFQVMSAFTGARWAWAQIVMRAIIVIERCTPLLFGRQHRLSYSSLLSFASSTVSVERNECVVFHKESDCVVQVDIDINIGNSDWCVGFAVLASATSYSNRRLSLSKQCITENNSSEGSVEAVGLDLDHCPT